MIKIDVYYDIGGDFAGPFSRKRLLFSTPYSSNEMEKRIKTITNGMIKQMENLYKEWLEENQIDYICKVSINENENENCIDFNSIIIFENDADAMAFKLMFQ